MASAETSSSNDGIYEGNSGHYPYPSHVNTASFVSIKLSSSNYHRWKEQMMCLVVSHDMLGFIDGTLKSPKQDTDEKEKANMNLKNRMEAEYYREWKRSDTLVKGWIFGSLSEHVMDDVVGLDTAYDVWRVLEMIMEHQLALDDPLDCSYMKAAFNELYRAVVIGDWSKTKEIFDRNKDALTAEIDSDGHCALHLAIIEGKSIEFIENLLKEIEPELLPRLLSNKRRNPLHFAAMVNNIDAAEMLVKKNTQLLFASDKEKCLPIHTAVLNNHKTFFEYLLSVSIKERIHEHPYLSLFNGRTGASLMTAVIDAGYFDDAYNLIWKFLDMAKADDENNIPLKSIASKWDAYLSGEQYSFYQLFLYSHIPTGKDGLDGANKIDDIEKQDTYNAKSRSIYVKFWEVTLLHVPHIKRLQEDKVKHYQALRLLKFICETLGKIYFTNPKKDYCAAITQALDNDTPEVIEAITEYFPEAIWTTIGGSNIPQYAITKRCEKVYNFMVHKLNAKNLYGNCLTEDGNNLLHLAGLLAPTEKLNLISGSALQMQRELQWFEEVKKFVHPRNRDLKNKNSLTPIMVFREEHKELRQEGEAWMKKAADSYTITAALILTIAFAAAITVPCGNNGETGKAICAAEPSFVIFAVSDAISMFTSTTSLLLFLSILTARYRDEDFLYTLPKRLIVGLVMLFLSVTSMIIAFGATLYLLFGEGKSWILIPIAVLTCLPIASFMRLQFPLLVEIISSTYGHGIFAKHGDRRNKKHL